MFHMMWNQAGGRPTGNQGLFHKYRIEAVTLQGVKLKNAKKFYSTLQIERFESYKIRSTGNSFLIFCSCYDFDVFCRMIEGVFRSLNNLLERFHQSFFFYLLPATLRYVSIGLYMQPFGLLAAPILVKVIARFTFQGHVPANFTKKIFLL